MDAPLPETLAQASVPEVPCKERYEGYLMSPYAAGHTVRALRVAIGTGVDVSSGWALHFLFISI